MIKVFYMCVPIPQNEYNSYVLKTYINKKIFKVKLILQGQIYQVDKEKDIKYSMCSGMKTWEMMVGLTGK